MSRLAALLALLGGCTLALDPDSLVFPEAPLASEDTLDDVMDDVPAAPEVVTPPDVRDVESIDSEDVPDAVDVPAILLEGAPSGDCTAAYKLTSVLGVLGQCARACADGDVTPWTMRLTTTLPGPFTWKLQATEGYVVLPKTASTRDVTATVAFEDDNCRASQSAPDFLVVATLTTPAGTTQRSIAVHPTLDSTCPPPVCE